MNKLECVYFKLKDEYKRISNIDITVQPKNKIPYYKGLLEGLEKSLAELEEAIRDE